MIEIIPATPEMADQIMLQSTQQISGFEATSAELANFIKSGPAFAAVDGSLLAIAGLVPIWPGRSVAWGLLSDSIGASMLPIHKSILRGLNGIFQVDRVEAYVLEGHEEGKRWMRLLGFEPEGTMKKFHNGQNFELFARLRG
jgi:hypothetical protein